MPGLESFLAYWRDPAQKQDDAMFRLFHEFTTTTAKLRDLRASTLIFLQPGKDSRGRWVPVFDDGRVDEVAALGREIEQADAKLKSVSNDIKAFLELSDGQPTLTSIAVGRNRILDRIKFNEKHAAAILKQALDRSPHESPAVLMQRSDVSEAYAAVERCKQETCASLTDLEERLKRARQIIEPYESEGKRGF